ncbi:MAG: histidine phosphatase family protein [Leptospirillia bacterium]
MQTVIVIRHAIAEERRIFVKTRRPDSQRPLTEKGFLRMVEAAAGIRRLAPDIATLTSSPWTRARQTADIIATTYGGLEVCETSALIPTHAPGELLTWMRAHLAAGTLAVVGHEPHLGNLIGLALHGRGDKAVPLKKGGACALSFYGEVAPGKGRLAWYMTPKELRQLGAGAEGPLT